MEKRSVGFPGFLVLGISLLLFNGVLVLTPAAAGSCTANCGGGVTCSCSGKSCTATDGVGCSGQGIEPCACSEQ